MNKCLSILTAALVFLISQHALCGTYGGGLGTAAEPYIISTAEQMQEIGANSTDWDKHFILTADIDMSAYAGMSYNIIGKKDPYFSGIFDGGGHVISNLTIDTEGAIGYSLGLFGRVDGEIKMLGLENVKVIAGEGSQYTGGLAGKVINGEVSNCFVKGSVTGSEDVGGITGYSSHHITNISNCFAVCSVNGDINVGGLVGYHRGGIANCYSMGSVVGNTHVGGLVGHGYDGDIFNCYALSAVSGYMHVGGIAGFDSSANYVSCFWNSDVNPDLTGIGYGGVPTGVMGRTTFEMQELSTFINKSWDFVGESANGSEDIWYMTECGHYPTLSWQPIGTVPEVTGLLEAEATSQVKSAGSVAIIKTAHSDVVPEGYVISQEPAASCVAALVTIVVSHGFPYEAGSGTEADPYQIWTAEQMNQIGIYPYDWDKYFILMQDIDLAGYTGTSFNIIGNIITPFTGSFDGDGYNILNFNYITTGQDNIGLFGFIEDNAKIRNLGLTEVNIDAGDGECFGGLAGYNLGGTITECYVTGNIKGHYFTGGLIGRNVNGIITNCYSICNINGGNRSGGLIGFNQGGVISGSYAASCVSGYQSVGGLVGHFYFGDMLNCYAIGNLRGYQQVGGLIGHYEFGDLTNCYASSDVRGAEDLGGLVGFNYANPGNYNNCFWDSQVNTSLSGVGNIADPAGVMGRTISEMQTLNTFTDMNWDFEDDWYMPSCGSPALSWQPVGFVSDVTGSSQSDAVIAINSAGPVADIKTIHSKVVPSGHVISQEPTAGCEAAIVTIFVSNGFPYEAGSGTEVDPYQIMTAEQLNTIGTYPDDLDKHFILMANIDMSAYTEATFNIIGSPPYVFEGLFDGNGHAVSGLTYASSEKSHVGLFGHVASDGQIMDLGLVDVNIDAEDKYFVGGLAGINAGTITNCQVNGAISGGDGVGLLVGRNYKGSITNCSAEGFVIGEGGVGVLCGTGFQGSIANCNSSGSVEGYARVGGLIGTSHGTITNCYSSSDVKGHSRVGGLVGDKDEEIITNCYASGEVSAYSFVGGLVGYNSADVFCCFSTGDVSGNFTVGGLIGNNRSHVNYCYSMGTVNVNGGERVGGLVGNGGGLNQCYVSAKVSGRWHIGSLIGYGNNNNNSCFWNNEFDPSLAAIGNVNNPEGMVGISSDEMQNETTFTDSGWDFVGESVNGDEDFWFMPECGYPAFTWQSVGTVPDFSGLSSIQAENLVTSEGPIVILRFIHSEVVPEDFVISQEPEAGCEAAIVTVFVSAGHPYYEGGIGTVSDPFQIKTAQQLNEIGVHPNDWDKRFVLTADFSMGSYSGGLYNVIGNETTPFSGKFDGDGYMISSLGINSTDTNKDYLGMFGVIRGPIAEVKNLGIVNVYIVGDDSWYVGGLAGVNEGTVKNCYIDGGRIKGSWSVGGLIGYNEGSIEDCSSNCEVSGDDFVGGLVGSDINGSITHCSSAGIVNGLFAVGGLSGENYESSISRCFAEGTVTGELFVGGFSGLNESTIINCYAVGAVNGIASIGGLFGRNYGIVTNCYSVGTVVGDVSVGGLTGGEYNGRYTSCFWDGDVNPGLMGVGNIDDPTGVMGRSTGLMQTANMYIYAGWDFAGEEINGTEDIWRLCVDEVSYPRLRWEHDSVGDFECPDGTAGEDLEYFVEHWLTSDGRADLNGDGVVTLFDFALFAEHWMEGV